MLEQFQEQLKINIWEFLDYFKEKHNEIRRTKVENDPEIVRAQEALNKTIERKKAIYNILIIFLVISHIAMLIFPPIVISVSFGLLLLICFLNSLLGSPSGESFTSGIYYIYFIKPYEDALKNKKIKKSEKIEDFYNETRQILNSLKF